MTAVEPIASQTSAPVVRRQFSIPEDDAESLDSCGLRWEAVRCVENGQQADWLIILDVAIPAGLEARDAPNQPLRAATMAIRVTGYPGAPLDMVYMNPPLARVTQSPIGGLGDVTIDGRTFQQWSRHYPYDPSTHCLFGHYYTALTWLEKAAK